MGIQKQLLKAGWHLREPQGVNILRYQVVRNEKRGATIAGVVIVNPGRFVGSLPLTNPHVVRVINVVDARRADGVSA